MKAIDLQNLIRKHIPLSKFMHFEIIELTELAIRTRAPLQPNINIHDTVFAGSQYTQGILTAWALVTHLLSQHNLQAELVAANAEIKYMKPLQDLYSQCRTESQQVDQFVDKVRTKGRGILTLEVSIGNPTAATLNAKMVATQR